MEEFVGQVVLLWVNDPSSASLFPGWPAHLAATLARKTERQKCTVGAEPMVFLHYCDQVLKVLKPADLLLNVRKRLGMAPDSPWKPLHDLWYASRGLRIERVSKDGKLWFVQTVIEPQKKEPVVLVPPPCPPAKPIAASSEQQIDEILGELLVVLDNLGTVNASLCQAHPGEAASFGMVAEGHGVARHLVLRARALAAKSAQRQQ